MSSLYRHLKERLIEETKSIVEKNLHRERTELIVRMQRKVNLLKEDQAEIKSDLDINSSVVSDFIEKVKSDGNIIDADKLRLHVDELESVTSLMTVLRVRLKTTENKLEVTKDQRDKVRLPSFRSTNKRSMTNENYVPMTWHAIKYPPQGRNKLTQICFRNISALKSPSCRHKSPRRNS